MARKRVSRKTGGMSRTGSRKSIPRERWLSNLNEALDTTKTKKINPANDAKMIVEFNKEEGYNPRTAEEAVENYCYYAFRVQPDLEKLYKNDTNLISKVRKLMGGR